MKQKKKITLYKINDLPLFLRNCKFYEKAKKENSFYRSRISLKKPIL
jgi:hypothetical protein